MARRRRSGSAPPIGDPSDPDGLWACLQRFSQWQLEKNYSQATVASREAALRKFITWAAERGLLRPNEITKPVRAFFKWLARNNYIAFNPASELELPRAEWRLPRHILTVAEVETVMAMPDARHAQQRRRLDLLRLRRRPADRRIRRQDRGPAGAVPHRGCTRHAGDETTTRTSLPPPDLRPRHSG